MKRILVTVVVAIATSSVALGQTTGEKTNKMSKPTDRVANELVSLERGAWDLWKAGDKGAFAALLADDFVNVDAHGFSTKSENVKEIDNLIKHEYRLWDFDVWRIGPDVALIVYKAHLKATYKGEPFEDDLYASSEWVRRGGKWLNIFYHETAARK